MDGRTVDMVDLDRFEAAGWRRRAHAYVPVPATIAARARP
jgi:hypothetical protein